MLQADLLEHKDNFEPSSASTKLSLYLGLKLAPIVFINQLSRHIHKKVSTEHRATHKLDYLLTSTFISV